MTTTPKEIAAYEAAERKRQKAIDAARAKQEAAYAKAQAMMKVADLAFEQERALANQTFRDSENEIYNRFHP